MYEPPNQPPFQPPNQPPNRPPFQQPYPPSYQRPYPAPSIDPAELRPRRLWYVVAGLLALVLVGGGIAAFVVGILTAAGSGGISQRFGAGETVTVALSPEPRRAIYARIPQQQGPFTQSPAPTPPAECTVTGPSGGPVALDVPGGTFTQTRNGVEWREIYEIPVTESGDHRIVCRSTATDAFALGDATDAGKLFGGIAGGLLGLFVLPITGIILAAIISVIVAVRRNNHKRRLLAQRYGPPSP